MIESEQFAEFARFGVAKEAAIQTIGFFLIDTFGMLPFISALEPLRAANRFSGHALYRWRLLGSGNTHATANNAMSIELDGHFFDGEKLDRLIVCGPHDPHQYVVNAQVLRMCRQYAARGTQVGALDTGSYILAKADLIKQRRCTIHWENMRGFREAFPELSVSSEIYEMDKGLFTCAGGTSSFDMMIELIRQDHGGGLAMQVADLFIATSTRASSNPQRRSTVERSGIYHKALISCIELMESNVEQPLAAAELADMTGVSCRQLERLFRAHLNTTPTLYYQRIRLDAGLELLRQTTLSVLDVASAVGFSSADYFSRCFKAQFGSTPSQLRQCR